MPTPTASGSRVLLRNGRIYAPDAPGATAMLTVGEQVAWVGDERTAATYAADADDVRDLQGRLVTPGFVDAHVHLSQTGFTLGNLDLSEVRGLPEALSALADFARRTEGAVLFAHGWDESRWPEARTPTMAELDRAVGDRVAYASRVDGHSAVVSSALVRRAPEVRDADGWRGDGTVERDAHHLARTAIAGLRSEGDRESAIAAALHEAARQGIVAVHEVNAPHIAPASDLGLVRRVQEREALPEVVGYWGALLGEGVVGTELEREVVGYAGDLSVDGSIGSHTARLQHRYEDAETCGHLYVDAQQVCEHVVFCTRSGAQAGFHVIGDGGAAAVVEGFAAAAEAVGADALRAARHRLEHLEMVSPEQVARLARWGVVASVQPMFDGLWGHPGQLYEQRLGADRAAPMNPFATLRRAGLTLAFGSDSPVTAMGPWAAVRAAVNHHNPDQRLAVEAAFEAHTQGGHAAARDDTAGTLAAGAPASYAVWSAPAEPAGRPEDDGREPPGGLPELADGVPLPSCELTVVRGRTAFDGLR